MKQNIAVGNNKYEVTYSNVSYSKGILNESEIIEIVKILDVSIFPGESGLPEDTVMVKFNSNNQIIMEVSKV